FFLFRQCDDFLQLLQVADVGTDDADGTLREGRQRMHKFAAEQAAKYVAPAFSQRSQTERRSRRHADEIDGAGEAAHGERRKFLRCVGGARIQRELRTEMHTRPRPPQPSTATQSFGPSSGSLALAL